MPARILVVDDSPFIHELVNDILTREGFEVARSMNGQEAMMAIGEDPPDLVLLDIIMPEMSGYQVCRLIRSDERLRSLPVVMMTAKDTQKDRFWGMEVGADAYITKPIEPGALLETIDSLLKERREPAAPMGPDELTGESIKDRADDILERKLLELTIINEVGKLYTFMEDPNTLLENVLKLIARVIDYDLGAVFVAFPGSRLKRMALSLRNVPMKVSKKALLKEGSRTLAAARKVDGSQIASMDTVILEDDEVQSSASRKKAESSINLILEPPRGALGCIMLHSHRSGFFSRDDRNLLDMIATNISVLMENVLLVQERDDQLENLQLEKNRVEAILRNMGEGVIVTDWSYRIIHANPVAHMLLGLDPGKLLGGLLFEHVPRRTFSVLEEQPIGEKNPTWNVKFHSIRENVPLIASVAVVDEEEEQTLGLIILLRDISAERELDNLRSRFLENISNQIRNPLASLSGFMDLFLEDSGDNMTPRQSEYLEVMTSEVVKLTGIVEDLLSMSRIELSDYNLSPESFPVAEIMMAAVSNLQGDAARRGVQIMTELPDDLTEVFADRESVMDVMSRLLANAIKFSPSEAEVHVGVRRVTEEASREMVELFVRDAGPGVPADRREAIFEKYQNHRIFADGKARSPGLGLPICRTLVEMNGGRIGYSVPAEGGSEFHFTLPARERTG